MLAAARTARLRYNVNLVFINGVINGVINVIRIHGHGLRSPPQWSSAR